MSDRETFIKQLFEDNYELLLFEAYRSVCDREAAQDLVQETFLLAIINCDMLMDHPRPDGWLSLTLRNCVKNYRRRSDNRLSMPMNGLEELLITEDPVSLFELLPLKLNESERRLLTWRIEDDLSCREIGERLGISEDACRVRIFRLLKKCRALLDKEKK